jgi:cytochrome c-type biogenesis protein CcmH
MNAILFASAFVLAAVSFAFVIGPLRRYGAAGVSKFLFPAGVAATLIAVGLYAVIGRPDAATPQALPQSAARVPDGQADQEKLASVDHMLAGLEQRLERQPDDAKGWLLLAKSYDHLGRKDESITAYARARELGMEDPALAAHIDSGQQAIRYPLDSREIESLNSMVD